MADYNLDNAPGGQAISPIGGRFYITISGVDYYIDYTNLVSLLRADITTNTANIATNAANIATVAALVSKQTYTNSATKAFALPANSVITQFVFYWTTGTPSITITTSSKTIMTAKTLSALDMELYPNIVFASPKASPETVTITITGGRADIIILYSTDLI